MKKLFIIIILTTFALACHKDRDVNVDPQQGLLTAAQKQSAARLSADEARVAASLGGIIPYKEAKAQMEAYQKTSTDEIKGVAFGKDIIEKLLDKKGVVGLRFYFTKGKDGKTSLVFVGINKDGKDVTATPNARSSEEEGVGGDPAPCPGFCNE